MRVGRKPGRRLAALEGPAAPASSVYACCAAGEAPRGVSHLALRAIYCRSTDYNRSPVYCTLQKAGSGTCTQEGEPAKSGGQGWGDDCTFRTCWGRCRLGRRRGSEQPPSCAPTNSDLTRYRKAESRKLHSYRNERTVTHRTLRKYSAPSIGGPWPTARPAAQSSKHKKLLISTSEAILSRQTETMWL